MILLLSVLVPSKVHDADAVATPSTGNDGGGVGAADPTSPSRDRLAHRRHVHPEGHARRRRPGDGGSRSTPRPTSTAVEALRTSAPTRSPSPARPVHRRLRRDRPRRHRAGRGQNNSRAARAPASTSRRSRTSAGTPAAPAAPGAVASGGGAPGRPPRPAGPGARRPVLAAVRRLLGRQRRRHQQGRHRRRRSRSPSGCSTSGASSRPWPTWPAPRWSTRPTTITQHGRRRWPTTSTSGSSSTAARSRSTSTTARARTPTSSSAAAATRPRPTPSRWPRRSAPSPTCPPPPSPTPAPSPSAGVIGFGTPYLSRAVARASGRPYAWSLATDGSIVSELAAEYQVKRLYDKPAVYAGGNGGDGQPLKGRPRKYRHAGPGELLVPGVGARTPRTIITQGRQDAGLQPEVRARPGHDVRPGHRDHRPDEGPRTSPRSSAAATRSSRCSCPAWPTGRTTSPSSSSSAPRSPTPTSSASCGTRTSPAHAFGVSSLEPFVPPTQTIAYAAYKSVREDEPAFSVDLIYYQMYMLAIGLQGAGPNLTPGHLRGGHVRLPAEARAVRPVELRPGRPHRGQRRPRDLLGPERHLDLQRQARRLHRHQRRALAARRRSRPATPASRQ